MFCNKELVHSEFLLEAMHAYITFRWRFVQCSKKVSVLNNYNARKNYKMKYSSKYYHAISFLSNFGSDINF